MPGHSAARPRSCPHSQHLHVTAAVSGVAVLPPVCAVLALRGPAPKGRGEKRSQSAGDPSPTRSHRNGFHGPSLRHRCPLCRPSADIRSRLNEFPPTWSWPGSQRWLSHLHLESRRWQTFSLTVNVVSFQQQQKQLLLIESLLPKCPTCIFNSF